jgi:5-methylcytosine-specific restriction endonuclease McrA
VIKLENKICIKCGVEYPKTKEYFYPHKVCKDGFRGECKKCAKQYALKNKEKISERMLLYREEHRDQLRERYKEYNKKYMQEHKEQAYERSAKYQHSHKEQYRTYCNCRRAKKMQLLNTLTKEQWELIKKKFNNQCAYCGKELPLQQEHFVPLSKGGEFTQNNIIPACGGCNQRKHNSDFFEWYPEQKFYSKVREHKILSFLHYDNRTKEQQLFLEI